MERSRPACSLLLGNVVPSKPSCGPLFEDTDTNKA